MSTDIAVKTDESSTTLPDYKFDAPELSVDVPWGSNVKLKVFYSKPEDQHHEDYEANVIRKQEIDESGLTDLTDPEPANVAYFDAIILRAEKYRTAEDKPFETWDREKCLTLPAEAKSTIVARVGRSDFEVIIEGDEDEALFDPNRPMKVRQLFGSELAPEHVIIYEMKPLAKQQRSDYEAGSVTKDKTKKRKTIRTIENRLIRKGKKHFRTNLLGVTGGVIEAGSYSADLRDDYLGQIDAAFQMLVIDTMNAYYKRGRE